MRALLPYSNLRYCSEDAHHLQCSLHWHGLTLRHPAWMGGQLIRCCVKQTPRCSTGKGFGAQTIPGKQAGAAGKKRLGFRRDSGACPCGSGRVYEECCQPYHKGTQAAVPEALMRARYSAYVKRQADFIEATTHPDNPQAGGSKTPEGQHSSTLQEDIQATFRTVEWDRLRVMGSAPGATEEEGFVRYRASFRTVNQLQHGQRQQGIPLQHMTETARFLRRSGVWLYVDGETSFTTDPP